MRCDYPRDFDEDYLEPTSEMFVQLFLQNAQAVADEGPNQGNEDAVNAGEIGGNIHTPIIVPASDESQSSLDSSPSLILMSHEELFGMFNVMSENDEASCNTENDSTEVYPLIDEATDVLSEDQKSDRSLTINSQNSGDANDISDVVSQEVFQETNDLDLSECELSKNSHSNETSNFVDSSVQTDIPPDNLASSTSNYASLFVVVPSTSLPSESDNLLSEVSSDGLLSPVNCPSSSLINEAVSSDDESLDILDEIWTIEDDTSSDSASDVAENDEKHHNSSELDSALDIEHVSSDTASEIIIGVDEHSHPEFVTVDAHSSEEMNTNQEGNSSCDITSDNSVPNLKRKINSVDDDSINKVSKCSVSEESSDAEMPVFCDEDEIDIVSSPLDDEDVFIIMDDC